VFARRFHSTCVRSALAACLAAPTIAVPGCSLWHRTKEKLEENLDMDKYRDNRAVDIDRRLSSPDPIVNSPF
jgi:hypothetical protein